MSKNTVKKKKYYYITFSRHLVSDIAVSKLNQIMIHTPTNNS